MIVPTLYGIMWYLSLLGIIVIYIQNGCLYLFAKFLKVYFYVQSTDRIGEFDECDSAYEVNVGFVTNWGPLSSILGLSRNNEIDDDHWVNTKTPWEYEVSQPIAPLDWMWFGKLNATCFGLLNLKCF